MEPGRDLGQLAHVRLWLHLTDDRVLIRRALVALPIERAKDPGHHRVGSARRKVPVIVQPEDDEVVFPDERPFCRGDGIVLLFECR